MKSLYDKNFKYTDRAQSIDLEAAVALKPIFDSAVEAGYSPREISKIMADAAHMLELEAVITNDSRRSRG